MARPDPILLLTLLGLIVSGLLATLHPVAPLDVDAAFDQAGRTVLIDLHVVEVKHADGWTRGSASPTDRPDAVVPWVWFRAPEDPVHVGDRLVGRAVVERDGGGIGITLSGPGAATVVPGPHPVPVRWQDLTSSPERYVNRVLVLNAVLSSDALVDPTDRHTCTLSDDSLRLFAPGRLLVRLERAHDAIGWHCTVEGMAP